MCGIFGYAGAETNTGQMVLDSLRQLEYRGYDSWGVAVSQNGHIAVDKHIGKIGDARLSMPFAAVGFGHTRWATHGGVTRANAHPHVDPSGRLAIIHNGIIENFQALRSELEARGVRFESQTDTEVALHLIRERLGASTDVMDVREAAKEVFGRLEGLNAVIILDRLTSTLTAIKRISPLVVGRSSAGHHYLASDQIVLADKADEVLFLPDEWLAQLSPVGATFIDPSGEAVDQPSWEPVRLSVEQTGLNGHAHYLIKEISEQPAIIERLADHGVETAKALAQEIRNAYGTFFLGCGTASYAALTGSYLFARIAGRHVNYIVGSEFAYQEQFLTDRSLVIALSQSGETADIIQSVLSARQREAKIGAVVNVEGSTLARMSDIVAPLQAGPEQCVLSTKAYLAKIGLLLLTAHALMGTQAVAQDLLRRASAGIRETLGDSVRGQIHDVARRISGARSMFSIGRGLSYPSALEAALKIKEVSYIHAEGFAGGELKHGVIALVEEGTPCLVFAPMDETRADIISSATELKTRGGYIIGVSPRNDPVFDVHIPVADVGDASPLVMAVPAQLLGYELALIKGLDPDKPRNLAKSVTVK
jgi:glucosamine--fructose-6-phosphate aminotransferase (isomerizing)